jgi:hypothetical protein
VCRETLGSTAKARLPNLNFEVSSYSVRTVRGRTQAGMLARNLMKLNWTAFPSCTVEPSYDLFSSLDHSFQLQLLWTSVLSRTPADRRIAPWHWFFPCKQLAVCFVALWFFVGIDWFRDPIPGSNWRKPSRV